jgi:hypothetical protein
MKRIFIFLVVSVAIFSCNNNEASNTDSDKDSYEKTKESLRENRRRKGISECEKFYKAGV